LLFNTQITGTSVSISENNFQLYHAINTAATAICTA